MWRGLTGLTLLAELDLSECGLRPPRPRHRWPGPASFVELDLQLLRERQLLAVLAGHPRIEALDACGTAVTDADLTTLATLAELRDLRNSHTAITDAGLAALAPAADRLQVLVLDECQLGPRGVRVLRQLHRLERLSLRGTGIDAAIAELQAALPHCRITI